MNIIEIVLETDNGEIINVLRENKNTIQVRDATTDKVLFSIDLSVIKKVGNNVRKYESIENCDILAALILSRLKNKEKEIKVMKDVLKDEEFKELCFDNNLNYLGSVIESIK